MDLSLVPTDDLVEALKARHDILIVAGMQLGAEGPTDIQLESWAGNVVLCQGLALDIIRSMQDWARQDEAE